MALAVRRRVSKMAALRRGVPSCLAAAVRTNHPRPSALHVLDDPSRAAVIFQARNMGGGPRNPAHKRKNLSKEEKEKRRSAKQRMREKGKKPKPPPSINHHTNEKWSKHMKTSIPKEVVPYVSDIETYIVQEWLPSFPQGARLRKLQRDVAWRMNRKQSPGKLNYESLLPIVGQLIRKDLIGVRIKEHGTLVIMPPDTQGVIHKKEDEQQDIASKKTEASDGAKSVQAINK